MSEPTMVADMLALIAKFRTASAGHPRSVTVHPYDFDLLSRDVPVPPDEAGLVLYFIGLRVYVDAAVPQGAPEFNRPRSFEAMEPRTFPSSPLPSLSAGKVTP